MQHAVVSCQGCRHDPPTVSSPGLQATPSGRYMQLLTGASALGSMLLDQPLARPTEIHVGIVDQQFHGSARGGRHCRQPYDPGTSGNGGMVAALSLPGSGTASSTPSNWTMEPTKPP